MIAPPSLEEVRRRLVGRNTETAEQIDSRLERIEYELEKKNQYDFVVINDVLMTAVEEIEKIIKN